MRFTIVILAIFPAISAASFGRNSLDYGDYFNDMQVKPISGGIQWDR